MTEEKKEEKKEEINEEKKVDAQAAPAVPQPAASSPQADTAQAKPAEAPKKPEVKKERPANCASCNKSIKNKQWYYRNEKFYCSKRCFKSTLKKAENAEGSSKETA